MMCAIQQLIEIIICIISFILGSEGYIYVNPVNEKLHDSKGL